METWTDFKTTGGVRLLTLLVVSKYPHFLHKLGNVLIDLAFFPGALCPIRSISPFRIEFSNASQRDYSLLSSLRDLPELKLINRHFTVSECHVQLQPLGS